MIDLFRGLTIAVEVLVVGAALRLVLLAVKRRFWVDVLRGMALAIFVATSAWVTRNRIGDNDIDFITVLNLVASVLAITGFFLAERRNARLYNEGL